MKNILLLLFLTSTLFACKAQTKEVITVVDVVTFNKGLSNNEVQLVDVRTPDEFKEGHIENAVLIDYKSDDFRTKAQELDVDKPLYLYCRSGKRSGMASIILKELGFKEIVDLEGGYLAWKETIKQK
ncbi:MAG: rhodanese-like domain-containing protein [Flavobacteriaceae bacterium]|nr:rhodanese-like domain-containing protein [Flavobacteriaceae bacterium]